MRSATLSICMGQAFSASRVASDVAYAIGPEQFGALKAPPVYRRSGESEPFHLLQGALARVCKSVVSGRRVCFS